MTDQRLDSWKEIAAYLKRDVTTVRRWEKREGLPVHRHLHERRDSVYAYTNEIDEWWDERRNHLAGNGADSQSPPETTARVAPGGGWRSHAHVAWTVAALFCTATIVLAVVLLTPPSRNEVAADHLQFNVFPPAGTNFRAASVSPDGRHVAFTTTPAPASGSSGLLWIRTLDSVTARPLPDTDGATFPFWSPSSDALAFFAGGRLWTIALDGAHPRNIAEAPEGRGGTWNRTGTIVFAPRSAGPLYRVASAGGDATAITALESGNEHGHVWPAFLPDGNRFVYLAEAHESRADKHLLYLAALDGRPPRAVTSLASNVAYSPTGHLLFERDHQLVVQGFDAGTAQLTGQPIALINRLAQQAGAHHRAEFTISTTGRLVYQQMQGPENALVWRDRSGRSTPLLNAPAQYTEPTLSPDDTRMAVAVFDSRPSARFGYGVGHVRGGIVLVDLLTRETTPLTNDPSSSWGPVWSPDGKRIVFTSNRRTPDLELFVREVSVNAGAETPLVTTGRYPVANSWSPDGRYLLYSAADAKTRSDLWLLPMSGDQAPFPLVQSDHREFQGSISPDGRWFAYTSDESGRDEIYVQPFPSPTAKWRVSSDGGGDARWRRDGKELLYIAKDRQLMAVPIQSGATFAHGDAVPVLDAGIPSYWYFGRNVYDISRDGRFVFLDPIEDDQALPLTVVVNWPALLHKYNSERASR